MPVPLEALTGQCLPSRREQFQEWCTNSIKQRRFHAPLVLRGKQSSWMGFGSPLGPHRTQWKVRQFVGKTVLNSTLEELAALSHLIFLRALSSMETTGDADINWPDSALERHSGSDISWEKFDMLCLCCLLMGFTARHPHFGKTKAIIKLQSSHLQSEEKMLVEIFSWYGQHTHHWQSALTVHTLLSKHWFWCRKPLFLTFPCILFILSNAKVRADFDGCSGNTAWATYWNTSVRHWILRNSCFISLVPPNAFSLLLSIYSLSAVSAGMGRRCFRKNFQLQDRELEHMTCKEESWIVQTEEEKANREFFCCLQ